MVEQNRFPAYTAEDPALLKKRVSLMLTYEQVLMVASSLALLHEYISIKNPVKKALFNPMLSESEKSLQTGIHNACINCALSLEELEKSRIYNEK
jgi:hypothetical protein